MQTFKSALKIIGIVIIGIAVACLLAEAFSWVLSLFIGLILMIMVFTGEAG